MSSFQRLAGKIALVTGAGSGIGRGISLAYAAQGAKVIASDINATGGMKTVEEITQRGGKARFVETDVTSEDSVTSTFADIASQEAKLDVVVSNAGVQHIDPVEKLSYENWRKIVNVHLDSAFLVTQSAVKQMYGQPDGGAIVYVGSVHSKLASPLKAPYVAAKHGLLGLARVVAKEGAKNKVRTHVLCPGFVRTPLVDKQIPEQAKEFNMTEEEVVQRIMLKDTIDGEFTTLEELNDVAVFLAEQKSLAMSGQSFIVSHGWYMQ